MLEFERQYLNTMRMGTKGAAILKEIAENGIPKDMPEEVYKAISAGVYAYENGDSKMVRAENRPEAAEWYVTQTELYMKRMPERFNEQATDFIDRIKNNAYVCDEGTYDELCSMVEDLNKSCSVRLFEDTVSLKWLEEPKSGRYIFETGFDPEVVTANACAYYNYLCKVCPDTVEPYSVGVMVAANSRIAHTMMIGYNTKIKFDEIMRRAGKLAYKAMCVMNRFIAMGTGTIVGFATFGVLVGINPVLALAGGLYVGVEVKDAVMYMGHLAEALITPVAEKTIEIGGNLVVVAVTGLIEFGKRAIEWIKERVIPVVCGSASRFMNTAKVSDSVVETTEVECELVETEGNVITEGEFA